MLGSLVLAPYNRNKRSAIMPKRKFGEILVEKGVVDWDQFNEGLRRQETTMSNRKIGVILTRLGYITEEDIVDVLKVQNPEMPEDQISKEVEEQVRSDEPTADLLSIKLPHYEMPNVSYDELKNISDPACPRRGVFPPAPRIAAEAGLTPEEWHELEHPQRTPEDEARLEPFCPIPFFRFPLMCVEINKAYMDYDHKPQRLDGFRIYRNEDESNEALAERVSQEFKAALLKIFSEHRDDEDIEI